jgi:hypothetical protein
VTGHGFKDGLEGHVSAFGMMAGTIEIGLAEGSDEFEVPEAIGAEEFEGGRKLVSRVVLCPGILVEGLEESGFGGGSGENLTKAEAEGEFAIGKVCGDLAWAPFPGSDGGCDGFGREGGDGLLEQTGC